MLYVRQMVSVKRSNLISSLLYIWNGQKAEFREIPHQTLASAAPPRKASKAPHDTKQMGTTTSFLQNEKGISKQQLHLGEDSSTADAMRTWCCKSPCCTAPLALTLTGSPWCSHPKTKPQLGFSSVRSHGVEHITKRHSLKQELCSNTFPSLAVRICTLLFSFLESKRILPHLPVYLYIFYQCLASHVSKASSSRGFSLQHLTGLRTCPHRD